MTTEPFRRVDDTVHDTSSQVTGDCRRLQLEITEGNFMANSAWLVLAAMAFNLTHAVGVAATVRTRLIDIAARVTRSARRSTLRLPTNWPWASRFQKLISAGIGPPKRT